MSNTKTEVTRGRGRPASFPDQETVSFISNLPKATKAMLEEVAKRREQAINITLDQLIKRGHREAMRSKKV